jgi:hypothetical protein
VAKRNVRAVGLQGSFRKPRALGKAKEKFMHDVIGTTWHPLELRKIVEADDLNIAPLRDDGATYGTPTWIWSVAVDGNLYVRGYNGPNSRWYQAAIRQKRGRIIAAGVSYEVYFEGVDGPINDRIDDAYREKYASSSYLSPMIGSRARAATVRIARRD